MARRTDASVRRIQGAVAAALPEGRIGVACSGGPDSVALADATVAVAGAARVVLVHVDHQLHAGSAAVADHVRALAARLGCDVEVEKVTVGKGASLEDQARAARYAALEAIARRLGLACMLAGHTARDQAETIVLRMIRGTGPAGLAGIPPTRGLHRRPLLALPREDVLAYCAARKLATVDDPMNRDARFTRVRVRTQLMPALIDENPRVEEALVRLAAAAAEWTAVIDARAAEIVTSAHATTGGTAVPIALLVAAGPAIGKRALQLLAPALEGVHLERVWKLTGRQSGRAVDIPGGKVERAFDELVFAGSAVDQRSALAISGPEGPYEVRIWRPGDRMKPARLRGRSRKLSDLYAAARVPRRERAAARVVVRVSDGAIVWAEHLGAAANALIEVLPDRLARAPFQG